MSFLSLIDNLHNLIRVQRVQVHDAIFREILQDGATEILQDGATWCMGFSMGCEEEDNLEEEKDDLIENDLNFFLGELEN